MPVVEDLKKSSLALNTPSITTISIALFGILVLYVVYQRFFHPLAKVPGPFWASLTRLWITKHSWDGDMHRVMIDLHDKHGDLVRTGPNEVSTSDPTAIKTIYGAGTRFNKSDWYSVWQGHRKFDLFAERNERLHGQQRKLISRPYSMESLKDLEPYVDDTLGVFFSRMNEHLGHVIDMGKWVQLFAFDIIGEITFSRSFGFLEAAQDDGSFSQIEGALQSAAWTGQMPWLYWLNDYLSPIFGNHLAINARHGSLRSLAVKEISARKDRGSDRKDILSKLFAAHDANPEGLDTAAVASMATSNIFAGSDTTAISTRAIIYYLLKNPQTKQRLVEEIDSFHHSGKLSNVAQLAEADNMPYLQAVMYEALRMHPAVGMSLPRVVPAGGAVVDGVHLPAGSVVGANPWVVHRCKEVYGEDVEVFRPERWLQEDKGDMRKSCAFQTLCKTAFVLC